MFIVGWLLAEEYWLTTIVCALLAALLGGTGASRSGIVVLTAFLLPWLGIGSTRVSFAISLLIYAVVALTVARRGKWLKWLTCGRYDKRSTLIAVGLGILCSITLIGLLQFQQEIPALPQAIQQWPLPALLLGGILFAGMNALLEELVFRGVMQDALESEFGPGVVAHVGQAAAFGVIHLYGVPGGVLGVAASFIFGILMSVLRNHTRGLFAPWLAHTVVDLVVVAWVLSKSIPT